MEHIPGLAAAGLGSPSQKRSPENATATPPGENQVSGLQLRKVDT